MREPDQFGVECVYEQLALRAWGVEFGEPDGDSPGDHDRVCTTSLGDDDL